MGRASREAHPGVTEMSYPTTPQDEPPHKDSLYGRTYNEPFDESQLGRAGTNDILGISEDGDHIDVIEQNLETDNMYHNRVFDDGL